MLSEKYVNTLKPGDAFRDWLVDLIGNRIKNKQCHVRVYKIEPASHTVCRYEFEDEGYSVVAKFYAEPTDRKKNYDPAAAMEIEFRTLRAIEGIINVPTAIAIRKDFHCVIVTEYVDGKPLYKYLRTEDGLYDKLTAIAHLLRRLHDNTPSTYRKENEFAHFHGLLDELVLDQSARRKYDHLLGKWWHSTILDRPHGCRIHNDPNPTNYIFRNNKVYALDFESSWEHANRVHDLGIIAAELKHYFAVEKDNGDRAEPYIGHFLWNYSKDEAEFRRISRAVPFFMGFGYLRMARLNHGSDHREYIFKEAYACLRSILH